MDYIKVRGARQHNLKNIDVDIPKDKLVLFTGVSGSGKSSLAFDTIYAEGQRRYVESLNTYARQFLGIMGKPDVDLIEGLSPSISIDQKTTSHNPRSTVGTVTEIYDYLRLLFARVGHPHCPICAREISSQSLDQITKGTLDLVREATRSAKAFRFLVISPVAIDRKGEFSALLENLKSKGFKRVRIDGRIHDLNEDIVLIKTNKHTIEAVIDRISVVAKDLKDEVSKKNLEGRLSDSIEQALKLSEGLVIISEIQDKGFEIPDFPRSFTDHLFSEKFACPQDNISLPEIEPRTFSFNSPHGACPKCLGLGRILQVNIKALFAEELSIIEGGILPFATIFEHDTWFARLIKKVCEEEGIDIRRPIKDLSEAQKEIILSGANKKEYRVEGTNRQGRWTHIREAFKGVIKELEDRYAGTSSEYVRTEIEKYMKEVVCDECLGTRLKKEALAITIDKKSISEVCDFPIDIALDWIISLEKGKILSDKELSIAKLVLKEIISRLSFLTAVGLEYLTLGRSANSLAGGEAQRIRLASQIGSGLTGVLYVLDEPTIGLHPRDNNRLIETLKKLRDLGNSVIVVEHDKDTIFSGDHIIDFGPKAGRLGGAVVAQGSLKEIANSEHSLTGQYLSGKRKIEVPRPVRLPDEDGKCLTLYGAQQFNLKSVDLRIPLGKFVVVTGVSGSGKSTLIVDTLYHALVQEKNPYHRQVAGTFKALEGAENLDKIILVDQSPIGRTPRSNPATYTKVFDLIRSVYTQTREARAAGFKDGRFSFNVKGGRCETCEGQGQIKIEMQFMPDIWVPCEVCKGSRYNAQTLEVSYKGKNISEVLKMTVSEAFFFFQAHPGIRAKLETLQEVGLDYMELGQPATTLSGGEAQRIKLASELSKKHTGGALYILDEPTTGLHFADLEKLLKVLVALVERGNTVLVIEHNLDVIRNADWVIDLGPEGGDKGGEIVVEGSVEKVLKAKDSHTGTFLRKALNSSL